MHIYKTSVGQVLYAKKSLELQYKEYSPPIHFIGKVSISFFQYYAEIIIFSIFKNLAQSTDSGEVC